MHIPGNRYKNQTTSFNPNYELIEVLGKGGMGYVYKALDKKLNREVALKVLNTNSDADSVKRFYFEAQAMKELDHQNIVHVFDFGQEKKQLFIAMTYVKGESLASVLHHKKEMAFSDIELIAKQVARGLLYAHNKGVIHRDIKPSNIMITHDNRVYIMDFGISYIQEMEKERLTITGMTMGTPEYMSPEQCHGDEVGVASDVYSLGVILFEMSCGRLPFTGAKPIEIAIKHVQNTPPNPKDFRPDIPVELSNLILKCLRKNPKERYQNMEDLLDALDNVFKTNVFSKSPSRKMKILDSFSKSKESHPLLKQVICQKLSILALLLTPILIFLLLMLTLHYKPKSVLQPIKDLKLRASYETKNLEGDSPKGYPVQNLMDFDLSTAWVFETPINRKNPILSVELKNKTLITHFGMAIGYQKQKEDTFEDRFMIFNKPKSIILKTKEGVRQKLVFENIKGMQYPPIQAIETEELFIYLEDAYENQASKNFAVSEIRLLGLSLK